MSRAADRLGVSTKSATDRSWLMNQAMFTVRRLVYGLTLGFGALTASVAALGFQFDTMMQVAQVSFTVLLGGAGAARREVQYLFDLAARTPFDFPGIQAGARQLLNYGFGLNQTNRYLRTFSDIVAGFGGDTTVIDRIVRAIGQMHTKGRVMGQELLQLQEAGVNATQYLREQLGLTQQQVGQIGRLGLRADVAIEAIIKGIQEDPKFKGAAAALQETTQGRLTTFHDYISRLFGDIMIAPFTLFSDKLVIINDDLTQLVNTLENRGFDDFVRQLDRMVGAGGRLVRLWGVIKVNATGAALVFRNDLLPAFLAVSNIAGLILYPLLILLGQGLIFAGHHSTLFRIVLTAIIARMVLMRSIMLAQWFFALGRAVFLAARAYRSMNAAQIIARITGMKMIGMTRILIFWKRLQVLWTYRSATATEVESAALNKYWKNVVRTSAALRIYRSVMLFAAAASAIFAGAGGGLAGVLAVLRWALLGVTQAVYGLATAVVTFLLTNPIGWIILVVAALAILYWRWQAFHDLVNRTARWIADHWKPIVIGALIALGGPIFWIAGGLALIITHLRTVLSLSRRVFGWVGDRLKSVGGFMGRIGGSLPFLAEGGTVFRGGYSIVGEKGPEVRYMPAGARVVPLQRNVAPVGFDGELEASVPIILQMDSDRVAEAVAKVRLQRKARR
jgi:tape measure domain-containing protein